MSLPLSVVELREEIDRIDDAIARLLAERFAVCVVIGDLKRLEGLTAADFSRERAVIERITKMLGEIAPSELTPQTAERVARVLVHAGRSVVEERFGARG